jgi:pyruvate formate lyase activating enzyme
MMGKIFNIQRFSVFDGPGVRTVVFFSGCNLKCAWCHNPESISNRQQLKFNRDQCIMCKKCFDLCKNGAHELRSGNHILNRTKCKTCLDCVSECYAEALAPVVRDITAADLEKSILTDTEYFKQSGGGVTFSGGEPLLQIDFLRDILKICKKRGIHTAVDTAGAVNFDRFEKILPWCDLFLYDIKAYGEEAHKKLTGRPNKEILENLKKLIKIANVSVRVPVILGANTGEMEDIAKFLSGAGIKKCELLPYHKLGEGKYGSLGIINENIFETPDEKLLCEIKNIFKKRGINV